MPVISKFYGIIVRLMKLPRRGLAIYASYGEDEVMLDAGTLQIISGSAPARVVELLKEWARQHHAELREAMNSLQQRRVPAEIAPLI
ncbi:MAG TPA: transcriptional regulator [Verrucomicrobiales bacterium]|nr:transcriptional regulator [Verrucomicrobiales bacterium]